MAVSSGDPQVFFFRLKAQKMDEEFYGFFFFFFTYYIVYSGERGEDDGR